MLSPSQCDAPGADPRPRRDQRFSELYCRQRRRMLYRIQRIVGDAHDAEDLVHDAFVRALAQWPRVGPRECPVAWLHTIARNCAVDLVRDRSRRALATTAEPDELEAPRTRPDEEAVLPALVDAIDRLPANLGVTILLHALDDLSLAQISALTSTTPGNVKVRLHRARRFLRERSLRDELR